MRSVIGPLRKGERYHPVVEQVVGTPVDGFIDRVADHNAWAFTLADEIRGYPAALPPLLPDAA